MGVSITTLLQEANTILGEPLSSYGYKLQRLPAEHEEYALELGEWQLLFIKESKESGVYYIIEFTFRQIADTRFSELTVILWRQTFLGAVKEGDQVLFSGPLATFYLDTLDDSLQAWHFANIEQLRETYCDVLSRLLRFGILWLEHPKVTWEHWVGMKPLTFDDLSNEGALNT